MKDFFKDCYGCKERTVGCHAHCEKYQAARAKQQKQRDERRAYYEAKSAALDITLDRIRGRS